MDGGFENPGRTAPKVSEPPAEIMQAAPVPPQLNICVKKGAGFAHPEDLVSRWSAHDIFGTEFQEFYADFVEVFGNLKEDVEPSAETPSKRKNVGVVETPPKKPRTYTCAESVAGAKILSATMLNVKKEHAGVCCGLPIKTKKL